MKKVLSLACLLLLLCLNVTVFAAEVKSNEVPKTQSILDKMRSSTFNEKHQSTIKSRIQAITSQENNIEKQPQVDNRPKVVVLYLNNAKTTYNDEVDKNILGNLGQTLPDTKYNLISGEPYLEKLNKMGIMDLSSAERSDIVTVFQGEDIDYCVFLEIEPFIMRDKVTYFTVGKDITAVIPFKIIDLVNNKYLYNGKFTEKASDSTILGGIGNKSVAMQALNMVDEQIRSVIETRVPGEKSQKIVSVK